MKKILIVDDEPNVRKLAALTLKTARDVTVFSAANGQEGLKIATLEKPDLILLDIMMPKMDGPSVAAALKENPQTQNIPLIFLTSLVQKDERHDLDPEGHRFMAKPFNPKELLDMVEKALKT